MRGLGQRIVRVAINLALAVASVSLTLWGMETVARRLDLHNPSFLHPSIGNCIQRSALLSVTLRPDCRGELSQTTFRTNAHGLRGPAVRDDGAQRILAVGDSCTWGWRVAEEESYSARLQAVLDQRVGSGRHQVINAGVPGHTSYQGLRWLRQHGMALQPSLVIAGFGFNDSIRDGDVAEMIERQAKWVSVLRLDDVLLDNSRLYKWLRWQATREAKGLRVQRVRPPLYSIYLTNLVELAREHGVRPVLLSFLQDRGNQRVYHETMMDVGRSLGVPVIWYEGPRMDVVHPTDEGYQRLATRIADELAAIGYLPAPAAAPHP